jgi:hypothetical protein
MLTAYTYLISAEAATFVEEAQNMIINFAESGFKEGQGEFKLNVSGYVIKISV